MYLLIYLFFKEDPVSIVKFGGLLAEKSSLVMNGKYRDVLFLRCFLAITPDVLFSVGNLEIELSLSHAYPSVHTLPSMVDVRTITQI